MKKQPPLGSWDTYKRKILKDPDLRREYEKLDLEYQVVNAIIGARIERGMTQRALAAALNTKQSVISRAEGANSLPSLTLLRRIADALDCTVEVRLKKKPMRSKQ
jgi:ribosome-binding protein aMBF1 (putative translation factor)